jgi:hypothetical protein
VYEFFGDKGSSDIDLRQEFGAFSDFMTLCDNDPHDAEEELQKIGLTRAMGSQLVNRYGKEVRRLHVDLRHDRERKVLDIRQNLESELIDQNINPQVAGQISALIETLVPQESAGAPRALLGSSGPARPIPYTVNVNQQFVLKAVEGNIIQSVQGTIHLNSKAKEILELVHRYAESQAAALESDVHEVEDPDAMPDDRRQAKRRLISFLSRVADGVQDVATDVLAKYLEAKIP